LKHSTGRRCNDQEGDYEKLWEAFEQAQKLLTESRNSARDWEKAARHARKQVGVIKVIK
jgi:hypothetical protein